MQKNKKLRKPIHGVLLLNKPLGFSSNQALQKVKWLLGAEKAGHTGTLDPLATGVLPLCFGAATKFSQLHLEADKAYNAILRLGVSTSTYDAEGEVVRIKPVPELSAADLLAIKTKFLGRQMQLPPMYSALKKAGKALYEYARNGETVERQQRQIEIKRLDIAICSLENGEIGLKLHTVCSKGTYIRSLAADIGDFIGCGAHLIKLERVATGKFALTQCVTLGLLEQLDEQHLLRLLLPVEIMLSDLPKVELDAVEAGKFLTGLRRKIASVDVELVQIFATNPPALLGTGSIKAQQLIANRLLNPQEIKQILLQNISNN